MYQRLSVVLFQARGLGYEKTRFFRYVRQNTDLAKETNILKREMAEGNFCGENVGTFTFPPGVSRIFASRKFFFFKQF